MFGDLEVVGGCVTTKRQCLPPELVVAKCVVPAAEAGYVTAQGQPTMGAAGSADAGARTSTRRLLQAAKRARFKGCCVVPNQREGSPGSTCKRLRAGVKYRASTMSLSPNPLKRMNGCKCFNLREFADVSSSASGSVARWACLLPIGVRLASAMYVSPRCPQLHPELSRAWPAYCTKPLPTARARVRLPWQPPHPSQLQPLPSRRAKCLRGARAQTPRSRWLPIHSLPVLQQRWVASKPRHLVY